MPCICLFFSPFINKAHLLHVRISAAVVLMLSKHSLVSGSSGAQEVCISCSVNIERIFTCLNALLCTQMMTACIRHKTAPFSMCVHSRLLAIFLNQYIIAWFHIGDTKSRKLIHLTGFLNTSYFRRCPWLNNAESDETGCVTQQGDTLFSSKKVIICNGQVRLKPKSPKS